MYESEESATFEFSLFTSMALFSTPCDVIGSYTLLMFVVMDDSTALT